ncbi:hypothetical protein AB751O23_CE_00020 [Chlamydiales bacterium SCGC AB-751-O23]|jgi:hypothetical protein|nr:hypothetical protein AB751O23_CE_00020 [Chlamydiales bacterium SCGC AB-751-O23]
MSSIMPEPGNYSNPEYILKKIENEFVEYQSRIFKVLSAGQERSNASSPISVVFNDTLRDFHVFKSPETFQEVSESFDESLKVLEDLKSKVSINHSDEAIQIDEFLGKLLGVYKKTFQALTKEKKVLQDPEANIRELEYLLKSPLIHISVDLHLSLALLKNFAKKLEEKPGGNKGGNQDLKEKRHVASYLDDSSSTITEEEDRPLTPISDSDNEENEFPGAEAFNSMFNEKNFKSQFPSFEEMTKLKIQQNKTAEETGSEEDDSYSGEDFEEPDLLNDDSYAEEEFEPLDRYAAEGDEDDYTGEEFEE